MPNLKRLCAILIEISTLKNEGGKIDKNCCILKDRVGWSA